MLALYNMNAQIHEVGVFLGGSNYIGDIGPMTYINPKEAAFGILYKWNKSPRHSWKFSYTQAKITSDDSRSNDPRRKQRDFDFENTLKEVSLGLEFNFFEFDLHEFEQKVTPYVFGGLSYVQYNGLFFAGNETKYDSKHGTVAIPMIVGIKSNITENIILGFEAGARYTFADDIDGSNPTNKNLSQLKFGNINSNDWYMFSGFTLTYTFGNKPCYCAD